MDLDARRIQHGYGHDQHSRPLDETQGSFAYHLRRYRKEYGRSGISQRALAMIAHVSRWFVEHLETSSDLSGSVEALLRVALTLQHPVEDLVAPEQLRRLRDEIERRRQMLGGDALPAKHGPALQAPELSLAVAYRSPHLLTAIADGKRVLEIRQRRAVIRTTCLRVRSLIEREAKVYGVREIIVEAGTRTAAYVNTLRIPHRTLSLDEAKRFLSPPGSPSPSNKTFFQALVGQHPELARYVKVLAATGRVAMSERWRTSRLVVAALALAAPAATSPTPPGPMNGRPSKPEDRPRQPGA
jgi:transcriptional regulator with XRE-family HTH domain